MWFSEFSHENGGWREGQPPLPPVGSGMTFSNSRTSAAVVWEDMIDLNTATAAQLDAIPQLQGHGFEIVRYRQERGRFEALRQLDEVPGLAQKWDGAETLLTVT